MSYKIAVMQPYFFPYIGYFNLMKSVDIFVLYTDVQFKKRSWMCRNYLSSNCRLTIPTICNYKDIIKDVQIDNNQSWREKHIKSIEHIYGKNKIKHSILDSYYKPQDFLLNFLKDSLNDVKKFLGIKCEIIESTQIRQKDKNKNFQEDIIHICKSLDANKYINLPGGRVLYDEKFFLFHHIELIFQEKTNKNLSIIDCLLNEKNTNI